MIINHKPQTNNGFTLVEMVVAVGLFIVILSILTSNFISMARTQAANLSLIESIDNLNAGLEQMAREMKMGYYGNNSFEPPNKITFTDEFGGSRFISYEYWDSDFDSENDSIQRCEINYTNTVCNNINSQNIKIDKFIIFLRMVDYDGNSIPPLITIGFRVAPKSERLKDVYFNIQTTISGRNLYRF